MAQRVPGMGPVQDDRRHLGRLGGRSDTPDASRLRPVPLQPAAQPVDTYARPEGQDNSSGLMALAQSLAAIQPSVVNFTKAVSEPEDTAGAARQYILTHGIEKTRTEIDAGNIPEPFVGLEGMRVYAKSVMYQDLSEITRRYNEEFDKDNGDFDAFVREAIAPTMERYGNDRAFREVYMEGIMGGLENLRTKHVDYQTTRSVEARYDTVYQSWSAEMDYKVAEGVPPAEIMEAIAATIPSNKQFLGMHPKEQQEMLLQTANDQFLKGNYDMAKTILDFERSDGPYKGSLRSDRNTSEQANALWARIDAEQTKARMEEMSIEAEEQAYAQGLQMAMSGSILSATDVVVPDKNGEPKIIKADTYKKEVGNRLLGAITAQVSAIPGVTDEQRYFTAAGIRHPVWFDSMNQAYTQMTSNAATLEGPLPPAVSDGFRIYRDLKATAVSYLNENIDGKARDFYEVADALLVTGLYANEEQALKVAAQVTRNPNLNDSVLNATYADIDAEMSRVVSSSGSWWSGVPDARNGGFVRQFVSEKARLFAKAGLPPEDAIAKAGELFEKAHVNVLGGFIPLTKNTPPDFSPLAEQFVSDWLEKNKSNLPGYDLGDVWVTNVMNTDGGFYIVGPNGLPLDPSATFTYRDLEALRLRNRETAAEEAAR